MTPRRTAVKTAVKAAAEFDFEAFLNEFRHAEFTSSLVQRADLAPELASRQKVLEDLDERIDMLEKAEGDDGAERDITAVNPLSTLIERRNRLTLEFNDLAETYNDSAVSFTFRVPDKKDDNLKIQALMDEVGGVQPDRPELDGLDDDERKAAEAAFEKDFTIWWDLLAIRSMSVTCIKHPGTDRGAPPLTVAQWEQLRETVGAIPFNTLAQAWFEAVQAAAPSAPFSRRPLPTPEPVPS